MQVFDPIAGSHYLVTIHEGETITVPAGEYDGAKITLRVPADDEPGAAAGAGWTIWLHGDSFIVKQVRRKSDGSEIVHELMSCSGQK